MVFTSSTNNTNIHRPEKFPKVIDETIFSDKTYPNLTPYAKSMMLKEDAVWDFKTSQKAKGEYCPELVAILPTTMAGEVIPGIDKSSLEIWKRIIAG